MKEQRIKKLMLHESVRERVKKEQSARDREREREREKKAGQTHSCRTNFSIFFHWFYTA